jgi:S-sulfo-L-cysteine synthase (O-acetyl-L-serine-dependent)
MNTVAFAPRTAHDVVGNIGNTPLLRLAKITADLPGIEIYGKAEYFNPGGSVKDRPGLNMILEGERSGKLTRDKILIDATSGNTGIAYAMIGAAKGYRVKLCLPQNASIERKRILAAYGAELVLTPADEGSDGAIRRVRDIYNADPDKYFYPDQYNNDANWRAHYETTGPEIMAQTDARLTHFVTLLGTSGTFMGNARFFRKEMPQVKCISAQPSTGFHGIEGTKHMPTAIVPGIYDPKLADENIWIDTEDAYAMCRRMAREEAVLIGISSGANLVAALRVAKQAAAAGETAVIVTILADGAYKYLSEPFWSEPHSA